MCRQWRFQHSGSTQPSTTLYIVESELACFACLCQHPLSWLRLLTLALSIGPCQCSYIYVSCWPSVFNLQVTWIKKYRSNGSLEYLRSRFTRAHPLEPELPSIITYFFKVNSYHIEYFLEARGLHKTMDLNSNPMNGVHSRIISNER